MPTSPNSLTITAMRRPWSAVRMRLRSVVFPAPRNPLRMMTGAFSDLALGSTVMALVEAGAASRLLGGFHQRRDQGLGKLAGLRVDTKSRRHDPSREPELCMLSTKPALSVDDRRLHTADRL